jgi:hypothetical protein
MPYILKEERDRAISYPRTSGELNYALTSLLTSYMRRQGFSYAHVNDCMGALEGAKAEFYRRVVVPYEDLKKNQNGDVYEGVI